ncbi:family 16 glycosylhydrolase [Hyphomonas sp. WL0036]|uniref:family 16 glycosylhydrolase n=1 Tax=Hyphomonas sediminis TaxID=2866160 RepID=UPI001C7FCA4E|nr:family 16 glycosylhydrolase [Hyphomonas sediminis]MBY9068489.1 family 16 glycosylhydrolase [Hyphomonas sediminis]
MASWAKLREPESNWLGAVLGLAAIALLAGSVLTAPVVVSAGWDAPHSEPPPKAEPYPPIAPDADAGASFIHNFGDGHDPTRWYKSNFSYPSAHPAWLARQIHFYDDRVELELRRKRVGDKIFAGAEYQRRGFYSFGRYEVVMTPAPGSGTVSSMFTHTDGNFDEPHDEIDIEFLGKDLTMVTGNYFTDGATYRYLELPLGFDASKEVHLYAFEWTPDEIRWYANDKLLHTATAAEHPIPQTPGRIIINLWTGSKWQYDWHGRPTFPDGTRAAYYCLSFLKAGDTGPQCSDSFDPVAANAAVPGK